MMGDPVITLENVSLYYRQRQGLFRKSKYFQAIKDLSMVIQRGENLGIIGRNGAGKSTLLKILAGILKPDEGRIINHGYSVSLLALQAGFDPELTGYENALLSGMLMGYTRKQMEAQMSTIQEFSELGEFMEQPIKTYSSGMRSRLGFSVAIHATPDILLLDEVLSVGDKEFRKKAEKAMTDKFESEQTIVLVSHSESQIERLCNRTIEL